jgi:hypothetical protein
MPSRYQVWVTDHLGERLASLETFETLTWLRTVNSVGGFTLIASPGSAPSGVTSLYGLDRRLQIWRAPTGGTLRNIFTGFMRRPVRSYEGARETITIRGWDHNHLLTRRTIGGAAGSSLTQKSDFADDMMKDFVDEWLGSAAAADDDITGLGLSIQSDSSAGPSVDIRAAHKSLLEALRKTSDASVEAGTPVFFDIVNPTPSTFEFRTYIGQRGTDRTTGSARIVFAPEFGNLSDPKFSVDRMDEYTSVIVGGAGVGEARAFEQITDDTRATQSAFNRIVRFIDARSGSSSSLTSEGEAALRQGTPIRSFSGDILDTPANQYQVDWDFGDKIVASWAGQTLNVEIRALAGAIQRDGRELIVARIEEVEQ